MNKKYFIITLDTEGDNLWKCKADDPVTTENSLFIPRFQELCEQYGFVPTYLCNWEMVSDDRFVEYTKNKLFQNKCEIGMHLHAWNNPPFYELPKSDVSGKPYLIEYPEDIMEKKIVSMTDLITERFDRKPVVHRAGRWTMNDTYFNLLLKHGYVADCSVTPGVSWKETKGLTPGMVGIDYTNYSKDVSVINGVIEVPVSTMVSYKLFNKAYKDILNHDQRRRVWWLRPDGKNLKQMEYLIDCRKNSKCDFLEFMIHSSELMPGGSPTFQTEADIEILYEHLKRIFEKIARNYEGIGLEDYAKMKICNKCL